MRLPAIEGVIRRRILINYRVDPDIVRRILPRPFEPKLHRGQAVAGICLIRLEDIRPKGFPALLGISSENAAHRIAVRWSDPGTGEFREGVFIPRRDTSSWINHLTGGRVFPGEHCHSSFRVCDELGTIEMAIRSRDGGMALDLVATESNGFPSDSTFQSLQESSSFFEGGSFGFSATRDRCRMDGLELRTRRWSVRPLDVEKVTSSYFSDERLFPEGSAIFDHALIMRDIRHEWHGLPALTVPPSD